MNIKRKFFKLLNPSPAKVRHAEYSMLYSADDEMSKPNDRLFDFAIESAKAARHINLDDIAGRSFPENYLDVNPGEHYKLLAGMVQVMKPSLVIEVGTAKGLSSLAMKKFLPPNGKIVTFDIIEWDKYPGGNFLKKEDFADGSLIQYIDDLSQPNGFAKHVELLKKADLIFVDAAKDGSQEQRFIDNFKTIKFDHPPIVVFDDIRLWNMLKIWRELSLPKFDITSFGHWSGTGIVDWKNN
jgi:predicted O-methyltransferase YrrM